MAVTRVDIVGPRLGPVRSSGEDGSQASRRSEAKTTLQACKTDRAQALKGKEDDHRHKDCLIHWQVWLVE